MTPARGPGSVVEDTGPGRIGDPVPDWNHLAREAEAILIPEQKIGVER
jgi:hypothetical protein